MEDNEDGAIRILIVDDDADERELFTETLKKLSLLYVVSTASGGTELFKLLIHPPLPHVIFMDINMPLPNGHECLQKLKSTAEYRHLPVLMYSISESPHDIEEAYKAGAHYYIIKPHAAVNLPGTLTRALKPNWKEPQSIPARTEFVIRISFLN